ncbi:MAG TPA: STAS/SEC14 domain-containing protein [Puia sp.]|jgi:hypothetical protein
MIGVLPDLPSNVTGFRATGEVTKEDFENVIFPEVKKHRALMGKLNFVLYVDTPLKNFSVGAWIRDIWLGLKQFASWRKIAIISDVEKIRNFTDNISFLLPGEYKGFPVSQLAEAIRWAAMEEQEPPAEDVIPEHIEQLLPPQERGKFTVTSAEVAVAKEADARYVFERATSRLLDVNEWTDHCGALAAGFQLTDDEGEPLKGRAAVGDFIRIDIPGPSTSEGKGYDWVRIEKIDQPGVLAPGAISLMQVRPCANPQLKDTTATAHFLQDHATSSFVVEWEENKVSATVFGRNEVPNTDHPGVVDNVRNAVVGSLGAIGLSKIQWKALVRGLLEKE